MAPLITEFSPTSYHLIPLRSKYSPQHPVLKHPQSKFPLNIRDQVPHPYKTVCKLILVLNFYVFKTADEKTKCSG
jgi:hypothetical protein